MMDRRAFIAAMDGSVVAAPLSADARQPRKSPRIGVLQSYPPRGMPRPSSAILWIASMRGLL